MNFDSIVGWLRPNHGWFVPVALLIASHVTFTGGVFSTLISAGFSIMALSHYKRYYQGIYRHGR